MILVLIELDERDVYKDVDRTSQVSLRGVGEKYRLQNGY